MFRRHVVKRLSEYLDNRLTETERRQVERHLAGCVSCREELQRLTALSRKLKEWSAPELGPDFDAGVHSRIALGELQPGEAKMKKTFLYPVPAGAIAGVVVMLIVAGLWGQSYVKRSYQGRLKDAADVRGEQYDPAAYSSKFTMEKAQVSSDVGTETLSQWNAPGAAGGEMPGEGPVIVIQPELPAAKDGDWVIRTAVMTVLVEDGNDTYKKASSVCQEFGGYLASSKFFRDSEGRQAGTIVMRIPKDKFLTCLDKLGALGTVENIDSDSKDVAQQYSYLKTQLDAAMVVYNKMMEALNKRQVTIPEAMRLESEITPTLRRVQELKNQIDNLNNLVSFTTVTINFHEEQVSVKALKETKNYFRKGMIAAAIEGVKFGTRMLPFLAVSAVGLVLLVFIALAIKAFITGKKED